MFFRVAEKYQITCWKITTCWRYRKDLDWASSLCWWVVGTFVIKLTYIVLIRNNFCIAILVPFNLDDIQKILESCLEKDYTYKFLQTWLGNGLFVAPGIHTRSVISIGDKKNLIYKTCKETGSYLLKTSLNALCYETT